MSINYPTLHQLLKVTRGAFSFVSPIHWVWILKVFLPEPLGPLKVYVLRKSKLYAFCIIWIWCPCVLCLTFTNLIFHTTFRHRYYCRLGKRWPLSRGSECNSLLAVRVSHTTRGTRDKSEKITPIIPAVGGTNINIPADIPAYPVTLLNGWWLRSMTTETIRTTRAVEIFPKVEVLPPLARRYLHQKNHKTCSILEECR